MLKALTVALMSAAISPAVLAQAPESGYDFKAFDSPEGWAMATTLHFLAIQKMLAPKQSYC